MSDYYRNWVRENCDPDDAEDEVFDPVDSAYWDYIVGLYKQYARPGESCMAFVKRIEDEQHQEALAAVDEFFRKLTNSE